MRASWTGSIAFVLAAAASAIGLGNLWRFPYLAAQYGGGTFILIYVLLVVTLGFTLMMTEISIGRKTRQSVLTAYGCLSKRCKFLGALGTLTPLIITAYYCIIGGWVVKYLVTYLQLIFTPNAGLFNNASGAFDPAAFFTNFISAKEGLAAYSTFGYGMLFALVTIAIVVIGVKNGIEKSNLVMMPLLFVMAIALVIYVLMLPGAMDGVKYCLVPNLDALQGADGTFSWARLAQTLLGAIGQMFYSLSLAMGIMVTYGSYMNKSDNIERSVRRIELFDTAIAIIAAVMIIPVVYIFAMKTGVDVKEAMNAGPGLMFITLPKVFNSFGSFAAIVGAAFFLLVTFAALTSAISLSEACVASFCDMFHIRRITAALLLMGFIIVLGLCSALGYGLWADIKIMGLQFLDFFDFITNSVMMPIIAVITCIIVGWVFKPRMIEEEVTAMGNKFRARGLYKVMVCYIAPMLMIIVLISEICRYFKIGGWSI